eukprot:6345693-Prymnesium_polylepis.1
MAGGPLASHLPPPPTPQMQQQQRRARKRQSAPTDRCMPWHANSIVFLRRHARTKPRHACCTARAGRQDRVARPRGQRLARTRPGPTGSGAPLRRSCLATRWRRTQTTSCRRWRCSSSRRCSRSECTSPGPRAPAARARRSS